MGLQQSARVHSSRQTGAPPATQHWERINTETIREVLEACLDPAFNYQRPSTVVAQTLAAMVDAVKVLFTYSPRKLFMNSDIFVGTRAIPPLFVRCAYKALSSSNPAIVQQAVITLVQFHRGADEFDYASQALLLAAVWNWCNDNQDHPAIIAVTQDLFSCPSEAFYTLKCAANGLVPAIIDYPLSEANRIWELGHEFIYSQRFAPTAAHTT